MFFPTKEHAHGTLFYMQTVSLGGHNQKIATYNIQTHICIDIYIHMYITYMNMHIHSHKHIYNADKLVLDPFCGSASLLVSAAHFGAHTIGGDIDIRVGLLLRFVGVGVCVCVHIHIYIYIYIYIQLAEI